MMRGVKRGDASVIMLHLRLDVFPSLSGLHRLLPFITVQQSRDPTILYYIFTTSWLPLLLLERSRSTLNTTTTTFLPSLPPLRAGILAIPRPSKMPRSSSYEAP
jgi:hypothetical protein